MEKFVPADQTKRACDCLQKLKQTWSISKDVTEFKNIRLTNADISDGEKFDKSVDGLKPNVMVEANKSSMNNFEDATRAALIVDSALWRAYRGHNLFQHCERSSAHDH